MSLLIRRCSIVLPGLISQLFLVACPTRAQLPRSDNITVVTPVFHQLLAFESPASLINAHEQSTTDFYRRESVVSNETLEQWSQMLTVTGRRGAAVHPGASPLGVIQNMADGFERACTETFAARSFGEISISGRPAYVALLGCGNVPDANGTPGSMHSETALIVVIAGDQDFYTIQWAERGPARPKLVFDEVLWKARFQSLAPIKVCPIIAGEMAPYPSCLSH